MSPLNELVSQRVFGNRFFMFHRYSILFGLSVTLSLSAAFPVNAQLTPDNTLGEENSIVNPSKLLQRIDGGTIRGSNLFHSFKEFNIDRGKSVYFSNPNCNRKYPDSGYWKKSVEHFR